MYQNDSKEFQRNKMPHAGRSSYFFVFNFSVYQQQHQRQPKNPMLEQIQENIEMDIDYKAR